MRAVICPGLGGNLTLTDVPAPPLPPGGARIAVTAAGINFADTLMVAGTYQEKLAPPFIPGLELAGVVREIAEGVETCRVGDHVLALATGGAFAEEAVTSGLDIFKLPEGLDPIVAAGFPVAYGTSHMALTEKACLRAGEVLLVHGAGSGVGLTAVEIGALLGATVIATAGHSDKLATAREHGAHHVINARSEDIRQKVKELTGGLGAGVVYDPVGGDLFDASLRAAAPGGRIISIGFASGRVPQIAANLLLVKNLTVIGFYWGAYRRLAPAALRRSLEETIRWWAEGRLRPHVSERFPLKRAQDALDRLKSRRATGKIVLTIGR